MIHAFDGYELDLARYELRRDGDVVPVEPQVFDVLVYLVEHRDRLVTKEELLDNVWGDRFVSESALTSRIKAARRAIGDDGSRQRLIRTAHGRGYRFVGLLTSPDAPAQLHPPIAPDPHRARRTTGRQRELAELSNRFSRAAAGERHVVFVAGSPGIGKTTLVEEFLAGLPADVVVGLGQCIELRGAGEAYLPVLGAIRHACAGVRGQLLADQLAQVAPSWVLQLPGLIPPDRADEVRARSVGTSQERMLRELLDAVCTPIDGGTPLVLALEDLHWSDSSTLDLLGALAADHRPAPLLLVATHRPSDSSSNSRAVHALAVNLRLRQRATLLTLDSLSADDVGHLIAARHGGVADSSLVALIHERTGGVPLFIEHLVADWFRAGWLHAGSGAVTATKPLAEMADAVPDEIRLLIEHSVELLSPAEQAVLTGGAVAGKSFTSAEVAAAGHQPDEDVEATLADLGRRGVLIAPGGESTWPDGTVTSTFTFEHDLHREVLYRRIGPARARAIHGRIGTRLEEAHRLQAGPVAAGLAAHFAAAGDLDRAVTYRTLAAEHQLRRSAHTEAIDHLRAAADMLRRLPGDAAHVEQALHVQIALGNALLTAKGYAAPETGDAYREARRLCDRIGDGAHVLPVLYGLWNATLVGGQPRAAMAVAESFLDLAERASHPATAVAHRALGWPLLFLGRLEEARAHLEQIPATLDEATTATLIAGFGEDPVATGCAVLAWARWLRGDDEGARAATAASLARATAVGHPLTETYVLAVAAVHAQMREEPDDALRLATAAVTIASEHGIPVFEALATTPLAWATWRLAIGDGVTRQREALAGMARTGTNVLQSLAKATLAQALAGEGDVDGAQAVLDDALDSADRTEERYYDAELHRLRAELLVSRGDGAGAAAAAASAVAVAEDQGAVPFAARASRLLDALGAESG
jgi:DNA-binding winged helix-turn-helix (wHTH) protein/predicted ATPase